MSLLLRREEEDDDEIDYRSEQECPCCQELILYTAEVFLLEIDQAAIVNGDLVIEPIQDAEGDYQFRPYILHLECMEEVIEQIREATEDQPPVAAEDPVLQCSQCGSTINQLEPFAASTFAEVQVSQRRPGGDAAEKILALDNAKPICLACMVHVIEDHFEDWEDLLDMLPTPTVEDEEEEIQ